MDGGIFIGLITGWLAGQWPALSPASRLIRFAVPTAALLLFAHLLTLSLAPVAAGTLAGLACHLFLRLILSKRRSTS